MHAPRVVLDRQWCSCARGDAVLLRQHLDSQWDQRLAGKMASPRARHSLKATHRTWDNLEQGMARSPQWPQLYRFKSVT